MASSRELPPSSETNVNILELNETVSRLVAHKGVEVVQILNKAGDVIAESGSSTQATMDSVRSENDTDESKNINEKHPHHAALVKKLLGVATTYVQSLDENDAVAFLQIRSAGGRELMIAPHEGFALVVLKRT
jgi:hypothetical protein